MHISQLTAKTSKKSSINNLCKMLDIIDI